MKIFKIMRKLLIAAAALGMFAAVPAAVYADEAVTPTGARIACGLWPDQATDWIKNGTSYSGGCPFGVNDVPSGNPVGLEAGNP